MANDAINEVFPDYLSAAEREALADVPGDELTEGMTDFDPEDVKGNQFEADDEAADPDDSGKEGADGDGAGATTDESGKASAEEGKSGAEDQTEGTDDTASAAAEDGQVDDDEPLPGPVLLTPPPKADLEKAQADLAEAKEKFDEGEIDFADYQKSYEAYLTLKNKAELVDDLNRQAVIRQWEAEQERFLKLHPSVKGNEMLLEFFAGTVNKILQTPEGQKMPGMKVLAEAKAQVENGLGIKIANIKDKNSGAKKADEAARPDPRDLARKAADVENARARQTVTLKDAPAADTNTDGTDKFAHLWRLSGQKFQDAINGMSEAARREFEDSY